MGGVGIPSTKYASRSIQDAEPIQHLSELLQFCDLWGEAGLIGIRHAIHGVKMMSGLLWIVRRQK
jgi:hypothetical protein